MAGKNTKVVDGLDFSDAEVITKEDLINNIIEKITTLFSEGDFSSLPSKDRKQLANKSLSIIQESLNVALVPYVKQYNSGQHRAEVEFVVVNGDV